MSYKYIVTKKGLDMIAQVQADPTRKIEFIRAEIGNGTLESEDIAEDFISLKGSIIHDAVIQKKEFLSDESVKITVNYSNENVTAGFNVSEVGLYAKDPLDESKEVLFLYCNSSEADFLPDNSSVVNVEQVVNLIIKMSNAENVTVTASSSSNVIRENFGDNTILKADTEGEPSALRVEPGRILGRKGSDSDVIEDLTPEETREILNVPELVDGKISSQHNNVTSSPRQAILALNDISFKTSNVKIADEHSYKGNGVVRELDFGMDFVTQNSVNQFGGIAFGKSFDTDREIRFTDTDMNENDLLWLSNTNSLMTGEVNEIRKFTEKGINIGDSAGINASNIDCDAFAFQTTKKERKKVYEGIKSVVLKCHNNWSSIHIGFRLIEFYNGEIPYQLTPSDYTTYASSIHSGTGYHSDNAFNTSQSLTGSHINTEWLTDCNIDKEQTLIVVFNTPIDITNLVINNSHKEGDAVNSTKDLDIYFTDQVLNESHTVWDSSIPNGEKVWSGRLSPHIAQDVENPQTIMYTPWRYNPNNGFAFHTRTGRGVHEQIKNPPEMDGMKLCFKFSKCIENGTNGWLTYTDKLPATQALYLNSSANPVTGTNYNNDEEPTSDHYSIGSINDVAERGKIIKDYCFFGKDLSYIEPGLTGVEGATAFFKADPSQTFDCGFEPQMIIVKSLETANNWYLHTKDKNFETVMMLSDPNIPAKSTLIVNGSKITAPSAATGKYLIIAFAEVVSVPADNKVINTLVKSSPGTLAEREVDMGMDFVSNENGGMILTKGGSNNWSLFDTIRGPLKRLQTDNTSAEDSDPEFLKGFTKNGVIVGSHADVNGESDQFYMGFQTDEKVKPPKWKAKSVIIDIADNYGAADYIRLRSLEFYKDGSLIPLTESDFTSFSTANNSGYEAKNLFITDLTKTGTDANTGWRSETNSVTDQRVVVVFNDEIEFDKVVINNGHDNGTNTNSGAKLIDIQITNHKYKSSGSYGDLIVGITNRIFKSNILEHSTLDEADDKIYVDISDEWQINRASGFGMCKITGTGANRVFITPFGKEPCMMWIKSVEEVTSWPVYFHAVGESDYMFLDTTGAETSTEYFEAYPDTKKPFSKEEFYLGSPALNQEYIIYAWFGDYYKDDALGTVNTDDSKRVMGIKGTTAFFRGTETSPGIGMYDTGIDDIETVMVRKKGGGEWNIANRNLNNFSNIYRLSSTSEETVNPIVNGSTIRISDSTGNLDDYLIVAFGRSADKDTKDYIQWMNQVNHIGTGETSTQIDLGLDFTGENGGMILQKSLIDAASWNISDTLRGVGKGLTTDANGPESDVSTFVEEFIDSGVIAGGHPYINKLNSEIATFGFNTTHKTKPTTRKVKSAVFKFEDNWGDSSYVGIRRIEFFKNDTLINLGDTDFTAYASSHNTNQEAKYAFITSGSKSGSSTNTCWNTLGNDPVTNQVIIIVFNTPQEIDYFRLNNFHSLGINTDIGAKNTKVYFTEDEYTDTSYFSEVPNSELVFDGIFDQHHASDAECYTQYLYTPWHYNPQTGFGFFKHKGNGTEITIPNILGKQPTMIWSKSLSTNRNWITYCSNVGEGKSGVLNGTNVLTGANVQTFKEVNKDNIKYGSLDNLNYLNHDYISYVWFGDDMSTLGNPQETYGIVGTSIFTEKKAADTEIELGFVPDVIIHKSISAAGSWGIYSLNYSTNNENIFDRALLLNTGGSVVNVAENSKIWVEGTKLKFGSGFSTDYLICAFAKNTYKPQGKSLVIHGSESNPSLFSIANGFNEYQAVEKLIGYKRNVVFNFNEGDGTYYIKLNIDGTITLKNQNCFYGRSNPNTGQDFFDVEKYRMFSPSGSVVPGIYIGKIVIQNDAILDVEKFQTGTNAIVDWFPVGLNSMYIKDNPFFTTEIDWDIWWNSTDSDENMRHVTGQLFAHYVSNANLNQGIGAYKRQNSNELIVGSAKNYTFHSGLSGDSAISTNGYYKIVIKRKF